MSLTPAVLVTDAEEEEACSQPFTGAIIYCPVCCTNDDAEKWGLNQMRCVNCDTAYAVFLSQKVVAEHSPIG